MKCSSIATILMTPELLRALERAHEEGPDAAEEAPLGHRDVVVDDALGGAAAAHRAVLEAQLLLAAAHRREVDALRVAGAFGHHPQDRRLDAAPLIAARRIGGERHAQAVALLHRYRAALLGGPHPFPRVRIAPHGEI